MTDQITITDSHCHLDFDTFDPERAIPYADVDVDRLIREERLGSMTVLAPRQSDEGLSNLGTGDTVYMDWSADAALILPKD